MATLVVSNSTSPVEDADEAFQKSFEGTIKYMVHIFLQFSTCSFTLLLYIALNGGCNFHYFIIAFNN